MGLLNIFLGTNEKLPITVGDKVQQLPHGYLFIPYDEGDAEMYVDNYLITGHAGYGPHVHVFINDKDGYTLILQEYIPDWTYKPIDWSKEDCDGEEYSGKLYQKICDAFFQLKL